MTKKVALVIAYEGYQQIEYNVPKEILEKAGIKVVTASNKLGMALGKDGSTTKIDVSLAELNANDYDGIFIIGGPGTMENLDNKTTYEILRAAQEAGKAYGGICIAARVLAKAGVLKGKKATGWNGDGKMPAVLRTFGSSFDDQPNVVAGNVITATGPESAQQFGNDIVAVLT